MEKSNNEISVSLESYIKELLEEYMLNKFKDINYSYDECLRIISKVLNKTKNEVYINLKDIILKKEDIEKIKELLDKRYLENIPLQYILGKQNFFNEEYFVNENVLIPRQDTEILVETAISYILKNNYNYLLDMCTGSGCVGISIANNSNVKKIDLVDVSKEALKVASKNICLNDVKKDINVIHSDLFSKLDSRNKKYDIIVSNPPYIKKKDLDTLEKQVKNEPILALDGGEDGMYFYDKILDEARNYLNKNSLVIFEIGYDELEDIIEVIKKYDEYSFKECKKDLAGLDRVVVIAYNG